MVELIVGIIMYYLLCKLDGSSCSSDTDLYKDVRKSGFDISDDDEENYHHYLYMQKKLYDDNKKDKK